MVVMKGVMPHTTPFMAGCLVPVSAGGSSTALRVGQHGCGLFYLPWWMGAVSRLLAEGLVRTGGLGSVMIDSQP